MDENLARHSHRKTRVLFASVKRQHNVPFLIRERPKATGLRNVSASMTAQAHAGGGEEAVITFRVDVPATVRIHAVRHTKPAPCC